MSGIKATDALSANDKKILRAELNELSKPNAAMTIWAISINWTMIIGLMTAAITTESWILTAIAFFLIPSRQHALLILMHEASHYRLTKSRKWNDLLCNYFCAFPHLMTSQAYRINHLAHHANFFAESDPDWQRKKDDARWRFPQSHINVLKHVLQDITGQGILFSLGAVKEISRRQKKEIKSEVNKRQLRRHQIVFYGCLIATLTYFGLWPVFFGLWVLPFLTIFPAIFRIRSMSEHFGLDSSQGFTNEFVMSRNFSGPVWERFLFAPLNVGYHLDHHICPSVPWFRMRKLHNILEGLHSYQTHTRRAESIFGGRGKAAMKDFKDPKYALPQEQHPAA